MNRLHSAYASAGLDASILAASPHRLVLMLFQGARTALGQARQAIEAGNVGARAHALAKAAAIIDGGLKASLDVKRGGALATQLQSLYDYMVVSIARANVDGTRAKVDEVDQLLAGLEESWREIGPGAGHGAAASTAATPAPREPLTYGRV